LIQADAASRRGLILALCFLSWHDRCTYQLWEKAMSISTLRDLPIEQRLHLVEELWDSIASDQGALPLTEDQRQELDRRLDAYELDGNPGRLADEVLADIRKRL
jgi:putative addiction module component (TIGR02574 family)